MGKKSTNTVGKKVQAETRWAGNSHQAPVAKPDMPSLPASASQHIIQSWHCPVFIHISPTHVFLLLQIYCFVLQQLCTYMYETCTCVHTKLALRPSKDTRWVKCSLTMGRMQFCQQRPCLVSCLAHISDMHFLNYLGHDHIKGLKLL